MKIRFTKSPTGKYLLAYSAGNEADIEGELAKTLIEDGYAVPVASPVAGKETADDKIAAKETRKK